MTETDLLALIANHEEDHLELTTSLTDRDKYCEAVCAFANDLPQRGPGWLVIGVDNSRIIAGLTMSDKFIASLGDIRSDGRILPIPAISVEKLATAQGEVAVVTVQPSDMPPVRFNGRVFIRVGPRRGIASEHEERILTERRVAGARTFDATPCRTASAADLATGVFLSEYLPQAVAPEIVAENNRPLKQQLASLRFYDLGADCPTYAGLLLFSSDPCAWTPGAYVQFLRVDGATLDDPILNDRQVSGDMFTQLRELDALVDAQLVQYPEPSTALTERLVEAFPRVAVRELLMNGLMHRSYESTAPLRLTWLADRIEIQSPGGLYGEASPENFPKQTSYRNPVVAEALKNLGYVNRYGRGVIRAQAALARNGSPPAEFEFDHGYVLATIRRRQ